MAQVWAKVCEEANISQRLQVHLCLEHEYSKAREEVDGGQIFFHTHSLDFAKDWRKKYRGSVLIMPTD